MTKSKSFEEATSSSSKMRSKWVSLQVPEKRVQQNFENKAYFKNLVKDQEAEKRNLLMEY